MTLYVKIGNGTKWHVKPKDSRFTRCGIRVEYFTRFQERAGIGRGAVCRNCEPPKQVKP